MYVHRVRLSVRCYLHVICVGTLKNKNNLWKQEAPEVVARYSAGINGRSRGTCQSVMACSYVASYVHVCSQNVPVSALLLTCNTCWNFKLQIDVKNNILLLFVLLFVQTTSWHGFLVNGTLVKGAASLTKLEHVHNSWLRLS